MAESRTACQPTWVCQVLALWRFLSSRRAAIFKAFWLMWIFIVPYFNINIYIYLLLPFLSFFYFFLLVYCYYLLYYMCIYTLYSSIKARDPRLHDIYLPLFYTDGNPHGAQNLNKIWASSFSVLTSAAGFPPTLMHSIVSSRSSVVTRKSPWRILGFWGGTRTLNRANLDLRPGWPSFVGDAWHWYFPSSSSSTGYMCSEKSPVRCNE